VTRNLFPLVSIALVLAYPCAALAQDDPDGDPEENYIYQYVDEDGELHFVDDLTLVPQSVIAANKLTKIPVEAPAQVPTTTTPLPDNPSPASRYETTGKPREEEAAKKASAAARLTDLRTRREELVVKMTLYEEGFLDADSKEPLTDEETERLVVQCQEALKRIDDEIRELEK